MDILKTFGNNIKRIRIEKKMSQLNLSFKCDLHRNYICDVERGKRNVSLIAIEKLAKGLDVDIKELFEEK